MSEFHIDEKTKKRAATITAAYKVLFAANANESFLQEMFKEFPQAINTNHVHVLLCNSLDEFNVPFFLQVGRGLFYDQCEKLLVEAFWIHAARLFDESVEANKCIRSLRPLCSEAQHMTDYDKKVKKYSKYGKDLL